MSVQAIRVIPFTNLETTIVMEIEFVLLADGAKELLDQQWLKVQTIISMRHWRLEINVPASKVNPIMLIETTSVMEIEFARHLVSVRVKQGPSPWKTKTITTMKLWPATNAQVTQVVPFTPTATSSVMEKEYARNLDCAMDCQGILLKAWTTTTMRY